MYHFSKRQGFTPLENVADSCPRYKIFLEDGSINLLRNIFSNGVKQPSIIVRELCSLTGFTLVEVLVALTILSMVLSIIFAAMSLGIRSWEKGSSIEETAQDLRALSMRLSNEIGSMYPYIIYINGAKTYVFQGERERLGFVTTNENSMPDLPRGGTKWVNYFLDRDKGLVAREKILPDSSVMEDKDGRLTEVEPSIEDLRFQYLESSIWNDSWDANEKKGFPEAIKVNLTFDEGEPVSIVVPIAHSYKEKEERL